MVLKEEDEMRERIETGRNMINIRNDARLSMFLCTEDWRCDRASLFPISSMHGDGEVPGLHSRNKAKACTATSA